MGLPSYELVPCLNHFRCDFSVILAIGHDRELWNVKRKLFLFVFLGAISFSSFLGSFLSVDPCVIVAVSSGSFLSFLGAS